MLGVVTATVNRSRAEPCLQSWQFHACAPYPLVVVENGVEGAYLGPVSAFHEGTEQLMRQHSNCDLIACFHDDLVILGEDWDTGITECFAEHPEVGLVSFGGATSLGTENLYTAPYHPDLLARKGYKSNDDNAIRGVRSIEAGRVVCPADWSLIARRAFWSGFQEAEYRTKESRRKVYPRPWAVIDALGIVDHFYDGALACLAQLGGWQVWYLPVRCRHLGGQTTTGDPGYVAWAAEEIDGGDRGFYESAHRIGYEAWRSVLPLRLA